MSPPSQVKSISWTLGFGVLVLTLLLLVSQLTHVELAQLTRDPMAVAKGKAYWGALSNLGNLIWGGAAAVALFSAYVLPAPQSARLFLAAIGALTAVLMLDDMFMLHEGPWTRVTGLDEKVVFALYALAALVILGRGWAAWSGTRAIFFVASVFFALSLLFDASDATGHALFYLFEDGSKFIGQCCWALFLWQTAAGHFAKP